MAGRMMMMKVLCLTVAFTVACMPYTAAIPCSQVLGHFMPCSYHLERGGPVPDPCCNGVKGLIAETKTTIDRQLACGCINGAFKSFPGFMKPENAVSLPGKCGVSIPYMNPNTDCNKVQ